MHWGILIQRHKSLPYLVRPAPISPLPASKQFSHTRSGVAQISRVAIVRDTLTNINTSIVPSFYEFFQESPGMVRFKDENRYMIINLSNGHKIEADLFGVNDPADLQRLQGASSWSLIWINDPAPMTEKGNAGVPNQLMNMLLIGSGVANLHGKCQKCVTCPPALLPMKNTRSASRSVLLAQSRE